MYLLVCFKFDRHNQTVQRLIAYGGVNEMSKYLTQRTTTHFSYKRSNIFANNYTCIKYNMDNIINII